MDFEVEAAPIGDGATLISVYGELDLATCGELARVAGQSMSTPGPVILDLTECPFIDSTGLREVLQISGPTQGDGAEVPVAIVSPAGSVTSDLFNLTGLDRFLKLCGTLEDATAWLSTQADSD